ncbi:MAG: sensor histidine kinase [Usitatibacter sp.]
MLHEFLSANRDELIDRCKAKVLLRPARGGPDSPQLYGVATFLDQLVETLRSDAKLDRGESERVSGVSGAASRTTSEIGEAALLHGRELLLQGYEVDEVVHDYGDLCQAVTELALEKGFPIGVEEFHTLNRCLDNAIADAVREYNYGRQVLADGAMVVSNERHGSFVHELRNLLNTASLAFEVIKQGRVGANGATGVVLGRSLEGLRELVERSVIDVRTKAGVPVTPQLLSLATFIHDVRRSAILESRARKCAFAVSHVDPTLAIEVDREMMYGALTNLLTNAFKFTYFNTEVSLKAYAAAERIFIDVSDNCGGLPEGSEKTMFLPFTQGSGDRSGLGLGLSISRRSVAANGGTLSVRNVPGTGCVFTIELPRRLLPSTATKASA